MKRILLLLKHQQNRRILCQWLTEHYEILSLEANLADVGPQLLSENFDLCFIDFAAIHLLREKILAKRASVVPIFLPFVFLTSLEDIGFSTDHLEPLIDDIVYLPTQQKELQTKLRVLLRSRSYSLQLQAAQKELNHALSQEKELNRLKSRFVSTVSHEFRNPLNSISGMAQILQTYGDSLSSEKKAEVLQQLQRNVTKMTDLLDDVLVMSRNEMGKQEFEPSPLNLETFCHALISEVKTVFQSKHSINLVYQAQSEEFKLDRKLLHHILTNLLSNACKYSPEDSVIDFKIIAREAKITFIIHDCGIGIPAAELPQLFESFYRASNSAGFQGTGLGLAIAKQYTELHQGAITVESELEVGTTFTVTIPTDI
ncbi:MAG TPA: HAMP domain-containing sensor histidine kinase [Coleofasciculaceae cyanobacterium]|jgi:signal transduction histidine kinase